MLKNIPGPEKAAGWKLLQLNYGSVFSCHFTEHHNRGKTANYVSIAINYCHQVITLLDRLFLYGLPILGHSYVTTWFYRGSICLVKNVNTA